ncbi:MAG: diphosphomevalonate decarboxylase [Candidatus Micrarchaeota archaeon]
MQKHVKVLATPNIAVVKYWGKRDEKLMLPTNSSLSFTMDEQLKTITEITAGKEIAKDELFLEGKQLVGKEFEGVRKVLAFVREKYGFEGKVSIKSKNYFPTGAGMASSASGYAALAFGLNESLELGLDRKKMSIIARLGSGSASRSVYGGFVEWQKGEKRDGSDSYAVQIADESHWPELRNVIAIVDQEKKKISSRAGMKETVATSEMFERRMDTIDDTVKEMKKAVLGKDFSAFAELTMMDSDSMHTCMADAKPPIVYLNKVSRKIQSEVRKLNEKENIAAYTFDAGPNAHIYTLEKYVPMVREMLSGMSGVKQVIACKVGSGPRVLEG